MKNILAAFCLGIIFFSAVDIATTFAQNEDAAESETVVTEDPIVFMFGRDECGFCKAQFKWMNEEGINYQYLNIITDDEAKILYNQVTAKHEISKVTPITVIGRKVRKL